MRKYIPFIGIILFPYFIVFAIICIFTGFLMDTVFNNNPFLLVFIIIVLFILSLLSVPAILVPGFKKKNVTELLRINMIIKLLHIPAYLLIFIFGLLCMITIFTIGVTFILMILDGMTIILSGLIGISSIINGLRENKISLKQAVIHGVLQFIYCVDVISSIVLYRTVKNEII